MTQRVWTGRIERDLESDDPEDCVIVFPEGLMEAVGWTMDTKLEWVLDPDKPKQAVIRPITEETAPAAAESADTAP